MLDDLLDLEDEEADAEQGAVIGIDLGTTNSVTCVYINGKPEIIKDSNGSPLHSSTVAWMPNGEVLIGSKAWARRAIDPENTVFSAKRLIGQSFHSKPVQQAAPKLPYRLEEGEREEVLVQTREGALPIPKISAYVLSHLKKLAEERLGTTVTHCVVTVPANFSDAQRAATRQAATIAGMEVLRILNEPTAAAIAYGQGTKKHERLCVFDLGGGTFDVTVLVVRDSLYEVVATGGDPFLGGDDIDHAIYEKLSNTFLREHRIDPSQDPVAKSRLLMAAEQIKRALSEESEVSGTLNEVTQGAGGKKLSLDFSITRDELDEMIAKLGQSTMETVDRVLSEAELSPQLIDSVILVGGSTRVPLIQDMVAKKFGKKPKSRLDPMKVVAMGAGLQAYRLANPDADDSVLLDVTPHSLRLATVGGFSKVLISKNSTVPAEGRSSFTLAHDNQESVTFRICQGEEERFDENVVLGELVLDELPEGRRGEVGIEVGFTIDADGILQITAHETKTKKRTQATLNMIGVQEER